MGTEHITNDGIQKTWLCLAVQKHLGRGAATLRTTEFLRPSPGALGALSTTI